MSDNTHLPADHLLHGQRIVIIGAGPAGLTLARLLQIRGVSVSVFERDAAQTHRAQGGSLDLHEDSGQLALNMAGLSEGFQKVARSDGQHSKVFNRRGELCAELRAENESSTRPEIDRGDLRALLLGALLPGTVRWDHSLVGVERKKGALQLIFETDAVEADLVLACDGGWSRCRPLVSDTTQPTYSGVTFIQTLIHDVDERQPEVAELVGPGSILALGDDRGLLAQRNGDGSIRIYVALRVPEDWAKNSGLNFSDAHQVRQHFLALFEGWSACLVQMIEECDDSFQPWSLYSYPAEQKWHPRSDLTLLGDAAHLMPPFTGKGANYAMLDALELADALTNGDYSTIGHALESYERKMLARMAPAIAETLANQDLMIAPDAPDALATLLRGDAPTD